MKRPLSPVLCSTGQKWSEDTVNLCLTPDGRPRKLTLTLKLDSESLNAKMILGGGGKVPRMIEYFLRVSGLLCS